MAKENATGVSMNWLKIVCMATHLKNNVKDVEDCIMLKQGCC